MTFQQLQFQGLPFRPDDRQVFYIEETFDLQYNRFFEAEYRRVSDAFQRHGLQFYYLPRLLRTAGIERKIRYYAPYLSQKIMSVRSIKSHAMLRYLANRNQAVEPSLIFSARNNFSDNTTTFLQLPLSEVCKDNVDIMESVISAIVAEMRTTRECERMVTEKLDCQAMRSEEPAATPIRSSLTGCFMDLFSSARRFSVADDSPKEYSICEEPSIDPEEEKSLIDTERILRELRDNVQKLRLEGVSLMAIHEFIDKQEPLSRMVITDDYHIFLPDYHDMEIEMGALPKAIYFLFLRYPEGIIQKHMPDYYNELLGIYRQLRPNTDEARLNLTVTKVVNPLGNALNENIARIRKAFIDKFDEHLACNYIITGERGQQYLISLDRDLITWEE